MAKEKFKKFEMVCAISMINATIILMLITTQTAMIRTQVHDNYFRYLQCLFLLRLQLLCDLEEHILRLYNYYHISVTASIYFDFTTSPYEKA